MNEKEEWIQIIAWEYVMLHYCANGYLNTDPDIDELGETSYLESSLVHLRNLMSFFTGKARVGKNPNPDIIVLDFLDKKDASKIKSLYNETIGKEMLGYTQEQVDGKPKRKEIKLKTWINKLMAHPDKKRYAYDKLKDKDVSKLDNYCAQVKKIMTLFFNLLDNPALLKAFHVKLNHLMSQTKVDDNRVLDIDLLSNPGYIDYDLLHSNATISTHSIPSNRTIISNTFGNPSTPEDYEGSFDWWAGKKKDDD